jgi:hypothetical protein
VYEHQLSCWKALFSTLAAPAGLSAADPAALDAELFGDVDPPRPTLADVATIVEAAKRGDAMPEYVPLEGRGRCDPKELALLAREKDLRDSEEDALLGERHTSLAKIIYPSMLDFRRAFDGAKRELKYPGAAVPPKGVVLFDPPPNNPLRPGPPPDNLRLRALLDETLVRGSELLRSPLRHDGTVEWTHRIIKGWYGTADFTGPLRGRIRINVLLNSPDVSAETIRFLLWHEFLHIHLAALHTAEFRRLERLWPDYVILDREMDALNEKFGVQYW